MSNYRKKRNMRYQIGEPKNLKQSTFFDEMLSNITETKLKNNIAMWDELFPESRNWKNFVKNQEFDYESDNPYKYYNKMKFDEYEITAKTKVELDNSNVVQAGRMTITIIMGPLAGQGFGVFYDKEKSQFIDSKIYI